MVHYISLLLVLGVVASLSGCCKPFCSKKTCVDKEVVETIVEHEEVFADDTEITK